MQHRNAMNPPPLPRGQSLEQVTVAAPEFTELEPDTQNDLPPITDPELLAALESVPTEKTPIPPPEETPNISDICTLRSPPPICGGAGGRLESTFTHASEALGSAE
ncbi:MAG: hypothetical protein RMJ98_00445 [Myxococcales bacterium]|nr:hypothetical protein [Polyangiaceae bacterium]MDW8247755.1 hypothetical protein [Myxococcales bacterium]